MVLIVEGSRKTGKTTFIGELNKFTVNGGHKVIPIRDRKLQNLNVNQEQANYISCTQLLAAVRSIEEALGKETLIVFDRFHISELVFGEKLRGYQNLGMYKIDNELANMQAKLLLFESETNVRRMKPNEKPYAEEFRQHFKESCLNDKALVCLDKTGGRIIKEDLEKILEMVGVTIG